jgi:hypothetical protein
MHDHADAGSEQGATLTDNVAAFGELGFTPHMGDCLPTGVQAVHPDGEVAIARAAANRGTAGLLPNELSPTAATVRPSTRRPANRPP